VEQYAGGTQSDSLMRVGNFVVRFWIVIRPAGVGQQYAMHADACRMFIDPKFAGIEMRTVGDQIVDRRKRFWETSRSTR
jgi:hypothetical protein